MTESGTKILDKDSPILREISKEVPLIDIKSKKIKNILEKMKEALHKEEDGVAIAAPQIGEGLRIFIVSGKALRLASKSKKNIEQIDASDLVFINPEITKLSKKKSWVEEGCLSIRWLYGQVKRNEKVSLKAYDENGKLFTRGASGLLAQIFQHETDHLDGILFTDKAENVRDLPPRKNINLVFFGSSTFSGFVLEELERAGFYPSLIVDSAKEPLPIEKLKKVKADVFVVASFGKILPEEVLNLPKYKSLNVHPSLLPQLRGPAPIQGTILGLGEPGITIIRMDEKMDHGPILAQEKIAISPWPDHYRVVEEKLGRAGGKMLSELLPKWVGGEVIEKKQEDAHASYVKLIKKEDGLLNLSLPAEESLKKVLAYSTWPGAYMIFKNNTGKEIRVIVKDAEIKDGQFLPTRVIPSGKREMSWQEFLRGNQN